MGRATVAAMLLGLIIGVIAVAWSIGITRLQARRRGADPARAHRFETVSWAIYLVLAALIYVGFALREAGDGWMGVELGGLVVYSLLAWLGGARGRGWLLAVGWALHAGWDLIVHGGVPDQFVPHWYRWACLTYDFAAAGYLLRLHRRRPRAA